MAYLCLVRASVITAARVVSLPVPAVVGIATNKGSFLCTFKIPFILDKDCLGFAILAPTALAQSILEPPPKPMIAFEDGKTLKYYIEQAGVTPPAFLIKSERRSLFSVSA